MTIAITLERLGIHLPSGTEETALNIRLNLKGDAKLWHDLRCHHLRWLYSLLADVRATDTQLALIDAETQHDKNLEEELLVQVTTAGDGVHASLKAAVIACERSVTSLEGAYELLAGLFKGEMRDITEESLARSLKGAKAQLEKLRTAEANYRLPRRPHEIRRTAISYLIVAVQKIVEELLVLHTDCEDGASADLLLELNENAAALLKLKASLSTLREHSSRRLENSLSLTREELERITIKLEQIAGEAGKRSGR